MGNTCQQPGNQMRVLDNSDTVHSQEFVPAAKAQANNNKAERSPSSDKVKTKKKEATNTTQQQKTLLECPFTFIRRPAPNFQGVSYQNGFKQISLKDFKGQYVVLFFFPYDFSEMCRKEILAFSDLNEKFQKSACQIIGCSQDSQFVHMNYCSKKRSEGGLGDLEFPLLSDVDRQISTSYGVIIEDGEAGEKGASFRSTFIIDNHQILRHMSINDIAISVNPEEVLRLVYTFQQNDRENPQGRAKMSGCPFAGHSKEAQSIPDIDTQSKYQRKKSGAEGESSKNVQSSKYLPKKTENPSQDDDELESIIVRLGGEEIVQDIADRFSNCVFSDPLLKPFFLNKISLGQLKKAVGNFLKTFFGSPQQYLGRNMKEAHKDLMLNDEHFNKASGYFQTIFSDMGFKPAFIHELIMYIEPLRSQITQKPTQSLFNRVNGEAGIRKAIKQYFSKILATNEIKPFYSKVDLEKTQEQYVSYISLVFGGPSKYKGRQMKETHQPVHIPEKVFHYCIDQMRHAFKETGVDPNSLNEIARLLECFYSEIPKKTNTLFERIGGTNAFEKACKKLYEELIMKEDKISEFFKGVDMKALGTKMVQYYSMITGGPFKYQGKSAKDAHKSFNIMSSEFEAYKALLKNTLLENGSSKESVAEFMNLLDTIKIDVIGGKPPSLFEKIGGSDALKQFNEKLFINIMEEKRIRHYFINVNLNKCKGHFLEFITMAMGGHSKYEGESVRELHEQMDISEKDYNVFMEVVKESVKVLKVKEQLIQEVINFFESMRQMIATVEE